VPCPDADLVDGDPLEVLAFRLGKAPVQVLLVDVLDDIPTDAEVLGHILDGHQPA
jgi:hypothetical protein